MEGGAEVKVNITIPIEEYNNLRSCKTMLGRISSVVSRYAKTPATTTYECVVKLNERERKLTETLKELKAMTSKSASRMRKKS